MGKSKALTRSASTEVSDANDNCDQIILVPRQLHQIASMVVAGLNPVEERIREYSEKEAEIVSTLEKMKRTGPQKLANGAAEWEESNGLVYYRGKLYVPNNLEICREILKQCHDLVTTGHPGRNLTLELVERHYWWPFMRAFVDKYV